MARSFRNKKVVLQPELCILISLGLLLVPMRWIIGWFIAVFFHELCHYLVLWLCKVSVFRISIGAFGVDMQTDVMTLWQEVISALAGPFGSLLLLIFLRVFPCISLCAFVHAVFNLMPIYPMDGGRALKGSLIALYGETHGSQIYKVISLAFTILLFCGGIYISIYYRLGIVPIVLLVLIVLRTLKIPCKERKLIVQ